MAMQSIAPERRRLDQRLAVGLRPQRRVHLHVRVERAHRLVGEQQVVRRGLAGHLRARRLRSLDRVHRLARGHVLHVDAAALVERERAVARHHRRLGHRRYSRHAEQRGHLALVHRAGARQRGILLVQREHPPGQLLVLKRLAHHPRGANGQPVVGEARRAHLGELGHLGEPLALLADGDRGHEAGRDARLAARLLAQRAQHRRRVHDRLGVGLGEDRAEAAGRSGARAGVDVLLVLAPGRAQVHVRVDEGRAARAGPRRPPPRRRRARSGPRPPRRSARRAPARRPACRALRAGRAAGRPGAAQWWAARRRSRARSRPAVRTRSSARRWHSCGLGLRLGALARTGGRAAPREQLVEHRHPHHNSGLHLL